MNDFLYVKESRKSFDDIVIALLRSIEKKSWALFQIYDIKERLAAKGFAHGRTKVIELCSAKHASRALAKNPAASACMPCRISVFEENGKPFVAAMNPSAMAKILDGIREEDVKEAEKEIIEIVEEALK